MKRSYKIALIIAILISLLFIAPALSVFQSISSDPFGWQAGFAINSTILWAATIIIGYGYLLFQTLLAIFGLFFGHKTRRKAFWLLVLPGFIGILLGLMWLGLFIAIDPEWPASWPVPAVLLAPPTTAFIIGRRLRRKK